MTAQIEEMLILNGKETYMTFCPPIPENDPRIIELKDDEIDLHSDCFSSACWREYIGTWEIKDNKFYLVNLEGRLKLKEQTPIFAEWFTGTLRIPEGEMLHYVHMGYGSVYEGETHIKIKKGIVIKSKTIDNRKKDVDKFELNWSNLPGSENRFDGDDEE